MSFRVPEKYRVRRGPLGTSEAHGNNGLFFVTLAPGATPLRVIASDGGIPGGDRWEHVSVSTSLARCPTWGEMCAIKALFWDDPEDVVVQYHPRASSYVSFHANCLHLWRPVGLVLPEPPSIMVGPTVTGPQP